MSRPSALPPGAPELFFNTEAAGGLVLLAATAAALLWANSPWAPAYEHLWELPLGAGYGELAFSRSLHFWVNDGLMAVFFLVVGLEIRRELHDGALSRLKLAALPLAAALGGVIVPAVLYLALTADPQLQRGWAVPTATDIAFATGVLALLGPRVPAALRVLLLAIAVIDDLMAILVIAFFYSSGIDLGGVAIAAAGIAGMVALQFSGVRFASAYLIIGVVVWIGLFRAGVHPALAGAAVGLLIPVASAGRAERVLHPWVAFGIMPLFALANAGIAFQGLVFDAPAAGPLIGAVVLGLVLGKPAGIVLATALCTRLGWCALPAGVDLKRVFVIGCLAGIGFTMSIFICDLAFPAGGLLETAKLAVLIASAIAAIAGLLAGRRLLHI